MRPSFLRRSIPGVLVAVAVVSWLGGCGDDNKVLKKAEYLTRADVICNRANTAVDRLQDGANTDDEAAIVKLTNKAFGLQLDALNDVRALGKPASDAKAVTEFLKESEAAFEQAKEADTEYKFGLASKRIENLGAVGAKLGFKVCGSR